MFICEPCLNEKYTNGPSVGQSQGACELCGKRRTCSAISSRDLQSKTPPPGMTVDQNGNTVRRPKTRTRVVTIAFIVDDAPRFSRVEDVAILVYRGLEGFRRNLVAR